MTREWGRPISSGSWPQATLIAGLHPVGQRVLITEDLEDVEVHEGSSATFSCRISPADYGPVQWFLDQTPLHPSELNEIQAQPSGYHVLTMRQLALKDSGTIHFEAGDQRASATLQVTGGLRTMGGPVHGLRGSCGEGRCWPHTEHSPGAHGDGAQPVDPGEVGCWRAIPHPHRVDYAVPGLPYPPGSP